MVQTSILFSDELTKLSPVVREATINAASIGWATVSLLKPGDVIMFSYPEDEDPGSDLIWRLALVVLNDTGATTYTSLRSNKLLTCFHLDVASEEIRAIILKSLYKKRLVAERQSVVKGLQAILGIENYRSYMISRMQDVMSLNLDMGIIELVASGQEEDQSFGEYIRSLGKSVIGKMSDFFGKFKRSK